MCTFREPVSHNRSQHRVPADPCRAWRSRKCTFLPLLSRGSLPPLPGLRTSEPQGVLWGAEHGLCSAVGAPGVSRPLERMCTSPTPGATSVSGNTFPLARAPPGVHESAHSYHCSPWRPATPSRPLQNSELRRVVGRRAGLRSAVGAPAANRPLERMCTFPNPRCHERFRERVPASPFPAWGPRKCTFLPPLAPATSHPFRPSRPVSNKACCRAPSAGFAARPVRRGRTGLPTRSGNEGGGMPGRRAMRPAEACSRHATLPAAAGPGPRPSGSGRPPSRPSHPRRPGSADPPRAPAPPRPAAPARAGRRSKRGAALR